MRFTKMHGAGNDFIIIDNRQYKLGLDELSSLSARLCPRRTAVGADGLIAVEERRSKDCHFSMLFFNSDGTLGEMCGNGARCLARFAYDKGIAPGRMSFDTTAGMVGAERISKAEYRVALNPPSLIRAHEKACGEFDCAYIELGNPGLPHAVMLMDDSAEISAEALRPLALRLRHAPEFHKGANVSFAKFINKNKLQAITFERGVEDFTLACGTGCGAIATALYTRGLMEGKSVSIAMPGGTLGIELHTQAGEVKGISLTGPVCTVYEAEFSNEI